MAKRKNPGREVLAGLYMDRALPAGEIATMYGVTVPTVRGWLRQYGIRRPRPAREYPDAEVLRREYIGENRTADEIGEKYGIPVRTVRNLLSRAGIRKEPAGAGGGSREKAFPGSEALVEMAARGMTARGIAEACGVQEGTAKGWLHREGLYLKRGRNPGREVLEGYVAAGMTAAEIAEKYGCCYRTVLLWLEKEGIRMKRGRKRCRMPCREDLYRLYVVERMTLKELAVMYGVSPETVSHWAAAYGIRKNRV